MGGDGNNVVTVRAVKRQVHDLGSDTDMQRRVASIAAVLH